MNSKVSSYLLSLLILASVASIVVATVTEQQQHHEANEQVPIVAQTTVEANGEANPICNSQGQEECINANSIPNSNNTTTSTTAATDASSPNVLTIPFPHMPLKIKAIVTGDYNDLDPNGAQMLATLQKIEATTAFAHARSTFYEHLKGTFQILSAWEQPTAVKRAGMVHTGYSGDLFQFYLFDSNQESDRSKLRSIIEHDAEALVYLFGTIHIDYELVFPSIPDNAKQALLVIV